MIKVEDDFSGNVSHALEALIIAIRQNARCEDGKKPFPRRHDLPKLARSLVNVAGSEMFGEVTVFEPAPVVLPSHMDADVAAVLGVPHG